jgi:hypothetical protein
MTMPPNHGGPANRRYRSPLGVDQEFGRAVYDGACPSAAVAELFVRRCYLPMRTTLLASFLSALTLSSCVGGSAPDFRAPATPLGITAASGAEQARSDIAAGHLQLMEAGTRGVFAPNVPADDARFKKLPGHRLPSGCTTPNASLWMRYAEAYNAVVVTNVQKQATR